MSFGSANKKYNMGYILVLIVFSFGTVRLTISFLEVAFLIWNKLLEEIREQPTMVGSMRVQYCLGGF